MIAALDATGNPSSVHRHGQDARRIVEDAREVLAASLGCDPIEVVLTSGGTESVNLAITGIFRSRREAAPTRVRIVLPEGEHHASLDTVLWLEKHEGAVLDWIPLDSYGRVRLDLLAAALANPSDIALVTMMWANNEVGTIAPVAEVASLCVEAGVPLHVDAIAAYGHEVIDFHGLRLATGSEPTFKKSFDNEADAVAAAARATAGLVALSLSGHKIGAVSGVGAVVVSRTVSLSPLIHGGGQQRGLRSGTQDAPAAASFAAAAQESDRLRASEVARLSVLRDATIARILSVIPGVSLQGDPVNRLDNNINITFPGCQSDSLLYLLDEKGVSVSTGSACQAGVTQASHVLLAMGNDMATASSALRITLGHTTTQDDLDALLAALPLAHERAHAAGLTA
jgi:cysteine desulfurase